MVTAEINRTDEHFREVVRQLRVCAYGETKMDWALGDIVLRECPNPGPGRKTDLALLEAFAEETGISYHTLSTHRRVSEAFPPDQRVDNLAWTVHRVFTPLPVPTRFMVLHRAGGWTVDQAKEYMAEATGSLTAGEEYEHQARQINDDLQDLPANFRDIALEGMDIPPVGKGMRPVPARSVDAAVLNSVTAITHAFDRLEAAYTGSGTEITAGTDDYLAEQLKSWEDRSRKLLQSVTDHRQRITTETAETDEDVPF